MKHILEQIENKIHLLKSDPTNIKYLNELQEFVEKAIDKLNNVDIEQEKDMRHDGKCFDDGYASYFYDLHKDDRDFYNKSR